MLTVTMLKPKAAVSWSGGKDSYLALQRVTDKFDVQALVSMFTEDGKRSRSHGLRPEVLARQAALMGIPLVSGRGSWATYEEGFKRVLHDLARDGFSHVIFGDIYLDAHKIWVERVCCECGLAAVEPLWGERTINLFREFLATGAKAQIVAGKASLMHEKWLGQCLREDFISQFAELGIDPCGERGEYHTIVINSRSMKAPLQLRETGRILHDGYWLLDLAIGSGGLTQRVMDENCGYI